MGQTLQWMCPLNGQLETWLCRDGGYLYNNPVDALLIRAWGEPTLSIERSVEDEFGRFPSVKDT
jgi:hypothetical protein